MSKDIIYSSKIKIFVYLRHEDQSQKIFIAKAEVKGRKGRKGKQNLNY